MTTAILTNPSSVVADDELYEVIDGKRVRTPPMGVFAVWIASELHAYIGTYARAHGLGRVLSEALFHLPAPVNRDRRPDIAFVSYDRWPKNRPIPLTENAWAVVPDLATEVVSPADIAEELERKIAEYFRVGVQVVWVIYPMQSMIRIFTSLTDITTCGRSDVLDGGSVLPGFRLPLADLFTQTAEEEPANHATTN